MYEPKSVLVTDSAGLGPGPGRPGLRPAPAAGFLMFLGPWHVGNSHDVGTRTGSPEVTVS
jgi:hypothetical protein